MSKKPDSQEQASKPEATKAYFVPEYGVSVEAVDLKQALSLAKSQQKGSDSSEN